MFKKTSETYVIQIPAGAAFLGIIGAAGMFLVEHYRQEKLRSAMARDLARLDKELTKLRSDLQHLQSHKSEKHNKPRKSQKLNNKKKANSVLSTTTEEYLSVSNIDSSDLEFYDVSDEEIDDNVPMNLDLLLVEFDRTLSLGTVDEIEETLRKLEDLCIEYPENPELLYRIGKAHYKVSDKSDDKDFIEQRLTKGLDACNSALRLAPEHADVHKWYAILIGSRADFQSVQDKISDGHLFKKHVDLAISINPNDESLHHMLGRFYYEVAGLKWYERKIAATLFGEPPSASFEDAYACFLEAERLANFDWKENKLMLAKCKIALSEYREAVEWLEKAKNCKYTNSLDDKVDNEIDALLNKYGSYR